MQKTVRAFAPATIANIGSGFDILGLALEHPGDVVQATVTNEPGITFTLAASPYTVPADHNNVVMQVANLLIADLKPKFGIHLQLQKNLPISSGLGSSAASSAATVFAINALLGSPLEKKALVHYAMLGEKFVSGAAHADNVAPALLGGVCLIRSYHPLDIIELPIQNDFYWIVAHPHITIETRRARELLPTQIPLSTYVSQSGNVAALVTALINGDIELAANAMQDEIAEPVRANLIPGFQAVKHAALQAGALAFSISGSGPSVFAITTHVEIAKKIAQSIETAFIKTARIKCDTFISKINREGAKLMETQE